MRSNQGYTTLLPQLFSWKGLHPSGEQENCSCSTWTAMFTWRDKQHCRLFKLRPASQGEQLATLFVCIVFFSLLQPKMHCCNSDSTSHDQGPERRVIFAVPVDSFPRLWICFMVLNCQHWGLLFFFWGCRKESWKWRRDLAEVHNHAPLLLYWSHSWRAQFMLCTGPGNKDVCKVVS